MIEVSGVNFTDIWCGSFKGKEPKFSRSALHVCGSCFKNLAFPCLLSKRHIIDRGKNFQTTKTHSCVYLRSPVYSYLLSLIGQSSCTKTLRTFTDTLLVNSTCRRFSLMCIRPLVTGSLNLVPGFHPAWPDEIGNEVDKFDSQLASQPVSRLYSEMLLHSLIWHGHVAMLRDNNS